MLSLVKQSLKNAQSSSNNFESLYVVRRGSSSDKKLIGFFTKNMKIC